VDVDGHRALLRTGLHHALVFAGGFDQHASFGQREALRFLDVGVAAACMAWMQINTRAWVVVSTKTASSFSFSSMSR